MSIVSAIETNNIDLLRELLRDPKNDPSINGNEAIIIASQNGNIDIVEMLLRDRRVDPAADNNLSIAIASQNGYVDIVDRLLRDRRVDPSVVNNAVIRTAAYNGHLPVVERLLQDHRVDPSDENNETIKGAVQRGHLEVVERLLQDDRVDPSDNNNEALRLARENNHYAVYIRLMEDPRVAEMYETDEEDLEDIEDEMLRDGIIDRINNQDRYLDFESDDEDDFDFDEDDEDDEDALFRAVRRNEAGDSIDFLVENRMDVVETLTRFNEYPVERIYPRRIPIPKNRNSRDCLEAFDVSLQSDVDIISYLNADVENKNKRIILFIGETPENLIPYTITIDYFLYNLHNTLYSTDCQQNVFGQIIERSHNSRMQDAIFKIQLSSIYPIFLSNLIDVLRNTDRRVFYILPLYDENGNRVSVERTASLGNLGRSVLGVFEPEQLNITSGWHCQKGTSMNMYVINACEGSADNPLFPVCSD